MGRFRQEGFSLSEVLLAIALISIALLALIGQSALLAHSSQKVDDRTVALDIGRSVVDRITKEALNDEPAGRLEEVWEQDSRTDPFEEDAITVGFTEYSYTLYIYDVVNITSGQTLGTGPTGTENEGTRLKRFDVKVEWWGGESQQRSGAGKLSVQSSKLVKVTNVSP